MPTDTILIHRFRDGLLHIPGIEVITCAVSDGIHLGVSPNLANLQLDPAGENLCQGAPARFIPMAEVAQRAYLPGRLPLCEGMEPEPEATDYYDPPSWASPMPPISR